MRLKVDRMVLNAQKRKLAETDSDASDFNSRVDKLINELCDDIQSQRTQRVVESLEQLRDRPVQNMSHECVNGALNAIDREIATIDAALEAQRRAMEIIAGGGGGGGGGGGSR